LGHKLILNPTAQALCRLGQMLLANIRRIQAVSRGEARVPDGGASRLVQALIQSSHRLLDTIVAQIALCESTMRESLAVAEWGQRLTSLEPTKLYKLLPLFDRVCDEIRRTSDMRLLIPMPGLPLAAIVESQSGRPDAANFVSGVMAARVLVWILGDNRSQARALPRLVLAALLQDVGRLPVGPGGSSTRVLHGQRPDWLEQQHPAIGAALFGSVRGAPIELPMLVAQHHEQLDGGGFPRALAASAILPESAILAAASRFAELCLMSAESVEQREEIPTHAADSKVGKSTAIRAAETLVSEAELGKWHIEFSRLLAGRIGSSETIDHAPLVDDLGEAGQPQASLRALSTADSAACDRMLQLHDHEQKLQGPHSDSATPFAGTSFRDIKSQIENV
jgi:hypothetical protein